LIMGHEIRGRLARKVRRFRKERGWTQEDLAEYSDLAYRHIQEIESKKPPCVGIDTLEKLAKAFKMRPSRLLD
jgi:transcriptional regulator with XRE-family HTH domain